MAEKHLRAALRGAVRRMPKRDFLRAYCSLAYLYPGFHPDCIDDWDGPTDILRLAREAWRRAAASQLTDNELYPYQATKAAIARGRDEAATERDEG
ncbi:MAG TPA: hypothetical protein VN673_00110 [Clostridia bacterium]|nr:hypothetical protein [Clostridia bacterium]